VARQQQLEGGDGFGRRAGPLVRARKVDQHLRPTGELVSLPELARRVTEALLLEIGLGSLEMSASALVVLGQRPRRSHRRRHRHKQHEQPRIGQRREETHGAIVTQAFLLGVSVSSRNCSLHGSIPGYMPTIATTSRLVLASVLPLAGVGGACVELPQIPSTPPPPAAPPPRTDDGADASADALRLGSWNVRKLGLEADKDLTSIAHIIDAHFDLIALLEMMWTERGPLLPELLDQLGPDWSGHITSSARPNVPSPHSEYYVVLYRPARIAPCAEQPELRFIDDADGRDASQGKDLFLREPAFGCYRTQASLGARDFLLGVYHARWGSGQASEIASEVRNLDEVFGALSERLPHEPELFMLGDFNLTPSQLSAVTRAHDRTRGQGSTLDAAGRVSARLYDHLLAYGAAADAALSQDAEVLDVRSEANDPASFRERVSDHLPIVARLPWSPDDD
jgi:hypothetical protein